MPNPRMDVEHARVVRILEVDYAFDCHHELEVIVMSKASVAPFLRPRGVG